MIEIKIKKKLRFSNGEDDMEVEVHIERKEFVALFGDSGAGKTSLLRMIAGFIDPDEGLIQVNGNIWFDKKRKINLPPQKRSIGFVFQDHSLFPNMTVLQNLEFAQPVKNREALNGTIDAFELRGLLNHKPDTLSGGQKQRASVARAIAREPEILLLDEPLSALDNLTRVRLQEMLLHLHRQKHITTLMVSHDLSEIAKLAQKVLVIEGGKVLKEGKPLEVFSEGKENGKVKFVGEVLGIRKEDGALEVSIVSENNAFKIKATMEDLGDIEVGDKVIITSKGFGFSF